MLQLIETLAGLGAAGALPSRNSPSIFLRRDLFAYFSVASSFQNDIPSTSALLQTILGTPVTSHSLPVRPYDRDVWLAVYSLVEKKLSPPTQSPISLPPTPVSSSSTLTSNVALPVGTEPPGRATSENQTPLKINSSSHMQTSGTHQILDPYLRFELNNVLYPNTDGFFNHFFGKPEWNDDAQTLLRDLRLQHGLQNPLRWRDRATDPVVTAWFYEFVNRQFLPPCSSRRFYASGNRALTGSKSARKCDIFLHPLRSDIEGSTNTKHDFSWTDVLVPGELKQDPKTCNAAELVLQLACYVREVFGAQPTRRFVHAFTICRDLMRCWVFHRAGGFGSVAFEIKREPERFLTVVLAYSKMDATELGFDPTIVLSRESVGDECRPSFITVSLPNGDMERIELHPTLLFHRPVIASRGTICWKARRAGSNGGWNLAVKDAWRAEERSAEGDLLLRAARLGVWGVAKYYAHEDITVAGNVDCTLNITGLNVTTTQAAVRFLAGKNHDRNDEWAIPRDDTNASPADSETIAEPAMSSTNKRKVQANHPSGSRPEGTSNVKRRRQQSSKQQSQRPANRIHSRTVVSTVGRPLTSFRSIRELLVAIRDAIKGHHSLLTLAHILHRDISINNIMISTAPEDADSPRGFLIDLDLAICLDTEPTTASGAPHRTGTMEFMAIGVLLGHQHTYRHDLESFLYVFLWICVFYSGPGKVCKSPATLLLATWSQHDFEFAAVIKEGYMTPAGYQRLLDGFTDYFKAVPPVLILAKEWREILFARDVERDMLYETVLEALGSAIEGLMMGAGLA